MNPEYVSQYCTGPVDNSGNDIFGRKVIYRNALAVPLTQSGTLTFEVCIDRSGIVTCSTFLKEESTIKHKHIVRQAQDASYGYRFEKSETADSTQCGKLRFILDIN